VPSSRSTSRTSSVDAGDREEGDLTAMTLLL
jgi:hypothetical protein